MYLCFSMQLNRTGLHYAASKGHYNVISSLLNWGSEVDAITGVSQYAHHVEYMTSCNGP